MVIYKGLKTAIGPLNMQRVFSRVLMAALTEGSWVYKSLKNIDLGRLSKTRSTGTRQGLFALYRKSLVLLYPEITALKNLFIIG